MHIETLAVHAGRPQTATGRHRAAHLSIDDVSNERATASIHWDSAIRATAIAMAGAWESGLPRGFPGPAPANGPGSSSYAMNPRAYIRRSFSAANVRLAQ